MSCVLADIGGHEQMGWHSQGASTSLPGCMSQPLAMNLHFLLLLLLLLSSSP